MCVEKNDTLGGTCLNVGCIPSKVFGTVDCFCFGTYILKIDKQEAECPEHSSNDLKALKKELPTMHNDNKYGDILDRGYLVEMFPFGINQCNLCFTF